jgi:flagellar basal-body rod protein FlgC
MIDPIKGAIKVAVSGLEAQALRIQAVSQNIANAESTGETPGSDAYRRKLVSFEAALGEEFLGVRAREGVIDRSPFETRYDPGNPAANEDGYVKRPNVDVLIEMADLKEASRAYEANLTVIKQAKEMGAMMIDLLRST